MLFRSTLNSLYGDNPTSKNQWTQINPSCVLAYLGLKGYGNLQGVQSKLVEKNGVPLLMYYDIFKNYYANTQEENFYTIGGSTKLKVTINGDTIENPDNIPNTLGEITSASTITLGPKEELTKNEIRFLVKTSIPDNFLNCVFCIVRSSTWCCIVFNFITPIFYLNLS